MRAESKDEKCATQEIVPYKRDYSKRTIYGKIA